MSWLARILSRLFMGLFRILFGASYQLMMRTGAWRDQLIETVRPRAGERILEVSVSACSVCAELAQQHPAANFAVAQVTGSHKRTSVIANNVEHVHCEDCCIQCPACSFDKVVCSLALHPLTPAQKIKLLKEMRRVLRHGGTLHLMELDQPIERRESEALKGTSYLFGSESVKSHFDGSWLKLIEQAGFVGVRRVNSYSEIIARVTLVRARRG